MSPSTPKRSERSAPAEKPCCGVTKKTYCFLKKICSPPPVVKFKRCQPRGDGIPRPLRCTVHFSQCEPVREISILISVIKKGFRSLCVVVANGTCSEINQKFSFFVDLAVKMDCFQEMLEKSLCSRKQFEDLTGLVKDWKRISREFSKEVEGSVKLYKCKKALIECLLGCFHSVEEKLYSMIAMTDTREIRCAVPKPKTAGSGECSKPSEESSGESITPGVKAKDSMECIKAIKREKAFRCSQDCVIKKDQCVQTSVWKLASELALKNCPASKTSLPSKCSTERSYSRPKCSTERTPSRSKCRTERAPSRPKCSTERAPSRPKCSTERAPSRPKCSTERAPSRPKCSTERAPSRSKCSTERAPSRSSCLPKRSCSELTVCLPKPTPSPQVCGMSLEYTRYQADSLHEVGSDTSLPDTCYRQDVPGGYAQASITNTDGQVQLTVRCLVQSDVGNAISNLRQTAACLSQPDNANLLAQNLSKMLSLSKNWYQNAKDLCSDILFTRRPSLCSS